jgi:hypothetical protein
VVCHGDLHPLNLLFRERELTGVVDWSNASLASPAFEIGWMRAIYLTIPFPFLHRCGPSNGRSGRIESLSIP